MEQLERVRRRAARRLRRHRWHPAPTTPATIRSDKRTPEVVSSYRVADDDRARMLSITARSLGAALGGSGARVTVADASDGPWRRRSEEAWAGTGLDVRLLPSTAPLAAAVDELVAAATTDVFALQFDDTITVGLDETWLRSAADLVRAYDGALVVAPQWPIAVRADVNRHRVEVEPHRRSASGRYRFWFGGWQRPVAVEDVAGHAFGIFVNFGYGFFFNNLVAERRAFAERLAWYRRHVSADNAHAIELAGFEWRGPVWEHVAVPLDGPVLLDLDYRHTGTSVRREHPERRDVCTVLEAGGDVVVERRSSGARS